MTTSSEIARFSESTENRPGTVWGAFMRRVLDPVDCRIAEHPEPADESGTCRRGPENCVCC